MRRLLVIGIGAGDPEQLTVQAVRALNQVDAFFVVDKGTEKSDLVQLRREVLDRFVERRSYRWVEADDPRRDRAASDYAAAVDDWRGRRADLYERFVVDELAEDECGGFLVWGDPTLYDGTIDALEAVRRRGRVEFEVEVIPGISSVSALAARHGVALNRVGGAVQITTGRRLSEGFPTDADDVVVMLDGRLAFRKVGDEDVEIYWGAYVGTKDEILVSGPVSQVADQIETLRSEARARKGWIMDTYLLRRRPDTYMREAGEN